MTENSQFVPGTISVCPKTDPVCPRDWSRSSRTQSRPKCLCLLAFLLPEPLHFKPRHPRLVFSSALPCLDSASLSRLHFPCRIALERAQEKYGHFCANLLQNPIVAYENLTEMGLDTLCTIPHIAGSYKIRNRRGAGVNSTQLACSTPIFTPVLELQSRYTIVNRLMLFRRMNRHDCKDSAPYRAIPLPHLPLARKGAVGGGRLSQLKLPPGGHRATTTMPSISSFLIETVM